MTANPVAQTESASSGKLSPDEQVAKSISEAMLSANLIDPSKKDGLTAKLAAGQMKAADWKALLEMKNKNGGK